jgi:hypothetical protein
MRNAKRISHFAFQILPFGFVVGSIQISNFELIRDIAEIVDFIGSSIV